MSDTHTVINADSATALDATWQSCRVDAVCNGLSHAGTTGRHAVSAFITPGFARSDAQDIDTAQWREVADNSTPSRQGSPSEPKIQFIAKNLTFAMFYIMQTPWHPSSYARKTARPRSFRSGA